MTNQVQRSEEEGQTLGYEDGGGGGGELGKPATFRVW